VHEVRVGRSATKELEGLPQQVLTRIANKIDGLATDPRPSGARKLRGADDLWKNRNGRELNPLLRQSGVAKFAPVADVPSSILRSEL
jgi:hypothetical protein